MIPDYYDYDPSKTHRYVDGKDTPIFPFGFGLSYTTFKFDGLQVEAPADGKQPVAVTVHVTNTGSVAGDEVAQLYVRQDVSSVETPVRALKGFARIHLAPGETKTVKFDVPLSDLALWNAEHKWVTEAGAYTVWVGDSSEATLKGKFTLQAEAR
jgi:beta-glucosidase